MFRKPASIILPFLLVISAPALAFNVQPVKSDYAWTETIYIRADGSIQPSTAPISSVDNVTYTLTDNIAGNVPAQSSAIIVQRDNITIDGAGYTLQGTRTQLSKGVELTGRSNVTIENMKITALDDGIYLDSSYNNSLSRNNITANISVGIVLYSSSNNSMDGNNIRNYTYGIQLHSFSNNNSVSGNTITNNGVGIWLESSSNNSVSGNSITANGGDGIWLLSSSNNTVSGNNIANNTYGILLYSSPNNSVSGNSFVNCGLFAVYSYGDVITDNLVNGKPLVYLEDVSNYAVRDADAGQVVLVKCNNVTVENLSLSHTSTGIELSETNNTKISGNNITANILVGIGLVSSFNNTVSGNNITANNEDGIWLYSSYNNSVSGNNITANGEFGIYLDSSYNNSLSRNNMAHNQFGIYLGSSYNNSMSGNNMAHNQYGICLDFSPNNSIAENTVTTNSEGGLCLFDSSNNNTIFHNNLINNAPQAVFQESYNNSWDDGYPSGGNYWSDYAGVDLHSGAYQNATGTDGIGDTPYFINAIYGDSRDTDRYPLMRPFDPQTEDLTVAIRNLLLEYNSLQSDFESLNSTYDSLLTSYASLQTNYSNLQANLAALNSSYLGLKTDYDALNASYNSLNASFRDYQQTTQNELADVKNTLYVFIAVTAILAVVLAYVATRKRNTKPETG